MTVGAHPADYSVWYQGASSPRAKQSRHLLPRLRLPLRLGTLLKIKITTFLPVFLQFLLQWLTKQSNAVNI